MTTKHTPDGKNPWLGFQTYQEIDARRFKGRSKDIKDLYNLVKDNPIVVCYADSGIGKSSLINAGLCPLLKKEQLFPIKIEVAEDCLSFDDFSLDENIINRIEASINTFNQDKDNKESKVTIIVEKDPSLDDPFLKMMDNAINSFIIDEKNNASPLWAENETSETPITNTSVDKSTKCVSSLWWYLHTKVFFINISGLRIRLTPFLVFDQFEEIFYKAKSLKQVELFFRRFREISMNTPTAEVLQVYEDIDKDSHIEQKVDFPNANPLKSLFSLRREYIANLDYWTSQKMTFPSFQANKYCLMPLNKEQAIEVITGQNTDKLNNLSDTIIQGLDQEEEAIPSILLSVICHELYDTNPLPERIDFENIILNAYNKVLEVKEEIDDKEIFIVKPGTVEILEERLTDSRGRRQQVTLEESGLLKHEYDYLINNHVIKETANGEKIELVHDKLAEVIRTKVQLRQSQEAEFERHRNNLRYNIQRKLNLENVLRLNGRELISNCIYFGDCDNERSSLFTSTLQIQNDNNDKRNAISYDTTSLSQLLNDTSSRKNHVCISFIDEKGERSKSLDGIFEIEATIESRMIESSIPGKEQEINLVTKVLFYDSNHKLLIIRHGFCGIQLEYNEKGEEIGRSYLGKDLKFTTSNQCYAKLMREYDKHGLVTKVRYFDINDNPCLSWDGNHGYNSIYNSDGQEILRYFFDLKEKPVQIKSGIWGQKYEYTDERGNISCAINIDSEGNAITDIKGYCGIIFKYDSKGRNHKQIFCNEDKNTIKQECGYAICYMGYNDFDQVSSVRYYDEDLMPTMSQEGIFGVIIEYDFQGFPILVECIDQYGNPMINKNGITFINRTFDNIGMELSSSYLDIRRQPAYGADNIHQTKFSYDNEKKIMLECSNYDEKGNLIKCKDGWTKLNIRWDEYGREILKIEFYNEEITIPYLSVIYDYHDNKEYVKTLIGSDGELQKTKLIKDFAGRDIYCEPLNYELDNGAHHEIYIYRLDKKAKTLYFDSSDEHYKAPDGNYGIEFIYDHNGIEIGSAYLDENGDRTRNNNGISVIKRWNDSDGSWEGFFDVDGETPVINDLYLCHALCKVDDVIVKTVGVNKELCNSKMGFAYVKEWKDNDEPNVLFKGFFDVNNKPALYEGWHKCSIKSIEGEETVSFFDIEDDLVEPYGYAIKITMTKTGIDIADKIVTYFNKLRKPCDGPNPCDSQDECFAHKWALRTNDDGDSVFYSINVRNKRVKGKFYSPYLKYVFAISLPLLFIIYFLYEYIYRPIKRLVWDDNQSNKRIVSFAQEIKRPLFSLNRVRPNDFSYVPTIVVEEVFDEIPTMIESSETTGVKSSSSLRGLQKGDLLLEYGTWTYDFKSDSINEFEHYFDEFANVPKTVTFARIVSTEDGRIKSRIMRFRVSNMIGVKFVVSDKLYNSIDIRKLKEDLNTIKENELKVVLQAIDRTSSENKIQLSNVYRNLGFVFREDKKYNIALNYYLKSINFLEGNPRCRMLDLSQLFFELAFCYLYMDKHVEAIYSMCKAIDCISKICDGEGCYASMNYKRHLTFFYIKTKNYTEAEKNGGILVELMKQLMSDNRVSPSDYAEALDDMAYILVEAEKWDESKRYEEDAISVMETNNIEKEELAQYYSRYSSILKELGDFDGAISSKIKSISIFDNQGCLEKEANGWFELSRMQEENDCLPNAEESIRKAISLVASDSQQSDSYKETLHQYLYSQGKFEEIIFTARNEGDLKVPIKIEEGITFAIWEWCDWNVSQDRSLESVIENNKNRKKHVVLFSNGTLVEFETEENTIGLHIQSQYFDRESKQYLISQYTNWLKNKNK